MAVPAKGSGSNRGMGSKVPTKSAPQPTKRASMGSATKRPSDAAPKRMN